MLFYEHAYADGTPIDLYDISQTVAYQFVNSDSRFVNASLTASTTASQVWRPGHPTAELDWNRKSQADFEAFHLIVICDPGLGTVNSDLFTGAVVNRALWSAAVGSQNNVLLMMGDPQWHSAASGAQSYIQQGLVFAAQNAAAGPGLFVTSGATGAGPLDFTRHVMEHLLDAIGDFSVEHGSGQQVSLLGTIPALACLTERGIVENDPVGLSYWGSSAHDGFHSWPAGFLPVAMVTDAQQHTFTPAASLAPIPARGLVHVVARGLSHRLWAEPLRQCVLLDTDATVAVKFTDAGGSPIVGQSVHFEVISGPHAGLFSDPDPTTDASGTATWQYEGTLQGADLVQATVLTADTADCDPTRHLKVEWAPVKITVEALVATAVEPATSGGAATVGSFRFTRTGDISGALTVSYTREGTAEYITEASPDYDEDAGGSVTFAENQTQVTVTVTPLFDGLPEAPETVVFRIVHAPDCAYAASDPDYATVTINSSSYPTVSLSVVDGFMDETGNNPGVVRLTRNQTAGDVNVLLAFSGTASFGADYVTDPPLNGDNTVTVPDGVAQFNLTLVPIPDSRSELPKETVTVTVLAGDQAQPGTPASVTLDLTDDDTVSLPASGYKLTDLGAVSGSFSQAFGVNTAADGAGGWRGQVVGRFTPGGSYSSLGFKWNNGSFTTHYPPSAWFYQSSWAAANSLNDACTIVGQAGRYYYSYESQACYWPVNQSYPTLLASLAGSSGWDQAALDINQRDAVNNRGGVIVGQGRRSDGKIHAVAWIPNASGVYATTVDLQDLGDGNVARNSHASAINDFGEAVGRSQLETGNNYHGFLTRSWQNPANNNQWEPVALSTSAGDDMGTATALDPHTSEFNDINAYGEIVGRGHTPSGQMRALYKAPGTGKNQGYYDLGVLAVGTANAGTESVAHAISLNGIIVGQSRLKVGASQVWRAFVMGNAGNPGPSALVNLNDNTYLLVGGNWVLATSQGWTLTSAERVNKTGWIAGYGTKSGQTRAFVLSPR